MSVKSFIDTVQLKYPAWNRSGTRGILPLLDWAQKQLIRSDASQLLFSDKNNEGFPPYLTTVSGTYQYSAPDQTVSIDGTDRTLKFWRVYGVFVDVSNITQYNRRYYGQTFNYPVPSYYTIRNERVAFSTVPITTKDATETESAKITFLEDPGSGSDIYFVNGVLDALELTSESIPFTIDENQYMPHLLSGVFGRIEQLDKDDESKLEKFLTYYKPNYQAAMNKGASLLSGVTPGRN